MTRTAMVGCGDVSVMHLNAIEANPDIDLVAVCDTNPGRLDAARHRPNVAGFADHRDLISRGEIEVAHIATPHFEHARLAIDFLDAGIDVILEKPMAHTLAAAEELQRAADKSTARLGICFQNRYNEANLVLRRLFDSGELGQVLGACGTVIWHRTSGYYADRPWRATWAGGGGGLLMNQAIHTIDLLQWMMGEVTGVSGRASLRSLGDSIEVEDTAEFNLTHASGAHSVFYATVAHARNAAITAEFVTESALLRLDGDLAIEFADGRTEVISEPKGGADGRTYWGTGHQRLIDDFHAGHGSGKPFWIDAAEAIKTIKIIDAVYGQSDITR